jgi:hypothetical protein
MTRSIDEILALSKDPEYIRVEVARISIVPQALRTEHAELDARLTDLRAKRDTVDIPRELTETADRLLAIEAEIEAAVVEFKFKGIGFRAWSDLRLKHLPTRKQMEQAKQIGEQLDHDPDTFPPAAIAASCVEPEMTVEQVTELISSGLIDVKAWNELWSACLAVNVAAADPKSLAAGLIARMNGGSSKRPTTIESPAVSSSDE